MDDVFDLAVVGGGINGCAVARDAAGRGAKVFLCEANDLGSATSSWSTKLIHGGLRYLENYEFRLVRESLAERERLLRSAPHLIEPMRFILPMAPGMRPAWMLRLGLFLYDRLAARDLLPGTTTLDLATDPAGKWLKPGLFRRAFEYSDCRADDARLVVAVARDARARGAAISPRTRAVAATRSAEGWRLDLEDTRLGTRRSVRARILVDATGPWVGRFPIEAAAPVPRPRIRLVQGSHIVVPRLFDHDRAHLFQIADGRVVFAIPYERDFTLIGTTDRDFDEDPAAVRATEAEIDYLLDVVNTRFATATTRADVVWSFSGVRPLADEGDGSASAATRDWRLDLDAREPGAPLLSILGGKLTTHRRLAEAVLARLADHLPGLAAPWTGDASLPGGDFPVDARPRLVADLAARLPFLAPETIDRLVRAYGTEVASIFAGVGRIEDLGRDFGAGLWEIEVRHLIEAEWAVTAEDILWRRSKLGLRFDTGAIAALEAFLRTL